MFLYYKPRLIFFDIRIVTAETYVNFLRKELRVFDMEVAGAWRS